MKTADYIRTDTVDFYLFCRLNPMSSDGGGIERLLEVVRQNGGALIPEKMELGGKTVRFAPQEIERLIAGTQPQKIRNLGLRKESDPAASYLFSFLGGKSPLGMCLTLSVAFSYFQVDQAVERSAQFFSLALELSRAYGLVYGFAHSKADISLGTDPHPSDPFAPYRVYEVSWLNLYGSTMMDEIGRDRVQSVPCHRMETLSDGGVAWLSTPSPDDFASDVARSAQARALAHLLPGSNFEDILRRLQERSATLAPVERDWDLDLQDVLALTLDDLRVAERSQQTAKLNKYRPPEVTEWRPASEALPTDVEHLEETVDRYRSFYAEQLIALVHKDIPEVMRFPPESLPRIDYHFWHFDYPGTFKREDIDNDLIPAVGAYLGEILVRHLGGQWIPRRALEESQVVIKDRAWLPFLRAKRYFESAQSALDYSLTKFYRTAERHAGSK